MRFSSSNPNSCVVGLYQEQCCHANYIINPVWKKKSVVRANSDSRVLQNAVGLRSLSRNLIYFLSRVFLFSSSNAHTNKNVTYHKNKLFKFVYVFVVFFASGNLLK